MGAGRYKQSAEGGEPPDGDPSRASHGPIWQGGLKPAGLSDRETNSLEANVEAHERRIDEAVFRLYGADGLTE